MSIKIGVIAVGGRGTRFERSDIQKCLVEIEGKPILEYTVEAFVQVGVRIIFFLTGFLYEQINTYLGSRAEESTCALASIYGGTEGEIPAILRLRHFITEDFLYSGGDCILPTTSIKQLIRETSQHKTSIAGMLASPSIEIAPAHPLIALTGKSKFIKEIYWSEVSGAPNLVGMGMHYFRPEVFKVLSKVGPTRHVSEFIKHASRDKKNVSVSITKNPWFCLHTPDDLLMWQNSAMRKFLKTSKPSCS